MKSGVTVAICCHNSARKIGSVLEKLQAQAIRTDWEVLVINNASTDATEAVAVQTWRKAPVTELRIVPEPAIGLVNARKRAFEMATYDKIAFLDDDNWPSPTWVQQVHDIFESDSSIGIVGGLNHVSLSSQAPDWFHPYLKRYEEKFTNCFAVGPQAASEGDLSSTRGHVWGAGLCIRKKAWQDLQRRNFPALCTGIKGRRFSRGEDTEVCLALRVLGWKIWYSPRLELEHRLDLNRVSWSHVRKLCRWGGIASANHQPYRILWRERSTGIPVRIPPHKRRLNDGLKELTKFPLAVYRDFFSRRAGNTRVLELESKLGQFLGQLYAGERLEALVRSLRTHFLEIS